MSFGHGIRPTSERETAVIWHRALECTQSWPSLPYFAIADGCWRYALLWAELDVTEKEVTSYDLWWVRGWHFFMSVEEVIHPPPCLIASRPLQLLHPMGNQKSKISTNTPWQRDPQKSKECVFWVRMESETFIWLHSECLCVASGDCAWVRLFLVKWEYHTRWDSLAKQEFFQEWRHQWRVSSEDPAISCWEPQWSPKYHQNKNIPTFCGEEEGRAKYVVWFFSQSIPSGKGSLSLRWGPCLPVLELVARCRETSYG